MVVAVPCYPAFLFKKSFEFLFLLFASSLLLNSCSWGGVDGMVDDYNDMILANGGLSLTPSSSLETVASAFAEPDPDEMLDEFYFKESSGTLQLRGPSDAASFLWKIYKRVETVYDDEDIPPDVTYELVTLPPACFLNGSSSRTEYLIIYIPDSGLEVGSYKVTLTVGRQGGKSYTDTAALIIYDAVDINQT